MSSSGMVHVLNAFESDVRLLDVQLNLRLSFRCVLQQSVRSLF
jgi:hypothetical protein